MVISFYCIYLFTTPLCRPAKLSKPKTSISFHCIGQNMVPNLRKKLQIMCIHFMCTLYTYLGNHQHNQDLEHATTQACIIMLLLSSNACSLPWHVYFILSQLQCHLVCESFFEVTLFSSDFPVSIYHFLSLMAKPMVCSQFMVGTYIYFLTTWVSVVFLKCQSFLHHLQNFDHICVFPVDLLSVFFFISVQLLI